MSNTATPQSACVHSDAVFLIPIAIKKYWLSWDNNLTSLLYALLMLPLGSYSNIINRRLIMISHCPSITRTHIILPNIFLSSISAMSLAGLHVSQYCNTPSLGVLGTIGCISAVVTVCNLSCIQFMITFISDLYCLISLIIMNDTTYLTIVIIFSWLLRAPSWLWLILKGLGILSCLGLFSGFSTVRFFNMRPMRRRHCW